jgi:3',5'-cyclic AMP phosphodiesterase CpdA
MRLIHISDPHLSSPEHRLTGRPGWGKRRLGLLSWRRRRRHLHQRKWLDDLTAAVHDAHPDLIVLTGDLVQVGLPEEIAEAADWLETLGPPDRVILLPGNHDNYAADSWSAITEYWQPYLHLDSDYPLEKRFADITLLGVSTALPTRPLSACGVVGKAQLSRLSAALNEPGGGPRLIALHHPPLPGMISYRKRLKDARRLERLIDDAGVDVILHGHGHHNQHTQRGQMRIYGVGSASYENASFRMLDIQRQDGGWRLGMHLQQRIDGQFTNVESDSWWKPRPYNDTQRSESDVEISSSEPSLP